MKKILSLLILLSAFAGNSNASVAPDTLSYPAEMIVMPVPEYEVETTASEDGNMKLYYWSFEDYDNGIQAGLVCQFRTEKGKIRSVKLHKIADFYEGLSSVSSLHSLKKNDGSTYYITAMESYGYEGETSVCLNAFAIIGDTIKEVSVYDGGDDLDDCGMETMYDPYDWTTRTQNESWGSTIEYYTDTKEIYIPQAIDKSLTDRYYVYRFNGNEFVKAGLQPHRELHSSLHNYRRLVRFGKVEFHKFRIDEMEDGTLRYASWYERSEMSEEPDIILHNGVYDEKENAYTFANGNYHYIVTEEEIIIKYKGKIQNRHKMKNFW